MGEGVVSDREDENIASRVLLRAVVFIEPGASGRAPVEDAIAKEGGELIQVLRGLVVAAFRSAGACLAACRSLAPDARAGASCGDVLAEGGLLHGLPVHEASRLKAHAGAGQILCSQRLLDLVALPETYMRDVGALELKGLEAPLRAAEVLR